MRFPASVLLLLLLSAAPSAAEEQEYYFRFTVSGKTDLDVLTHLISIDNVRHDTVWAYAWGESWKSLLSTMGYSPEILPHPGSTEQHRMSDAANGVLAWDTYPTYQGYRTMMRQFFMNYPNLCRLDTIGQSIQGRQILAIKISDNPGIREDEPQFLYTSSIHGDETVGYVLMLRLADYLLTQYGLQTPEGIRVTRLVDSMEIWINPLFNPDGTYRYGGDTTVTGATRGNAHGVDMNRDFPDRINDTLNTTAGREPETGAMMRWTWKHNFTMSANFHGGTRVVNYPWDNGAPSGTPSIHPDDAWFIQASSAYATPNADLMSGDFPNGITNGCAWYAVFGGRQDWMTWRCGGREVTIELWDTKNPAGSVLPARWNSNKESFLAFLEQALKGIRGTVVDDLTGAPLKAQIDVIGITGSPVYTDSSVGDYHRLLLPGTYRLIVRAAGHVPDTSGSIVVGSGAATRADVRLTPLPTTVTQHADEGWNLFALPLSVADARTSAVYPSAVLPAYAFDTMNGYLAADTLHAGAGYWVRFPAAMNVPVTGLARPHDTVSVSAGWNLIGSASTPVPVSAIVQVPPGIVLTPFTGYAGSYVDADTLAPGLGYWVKVGSDGTLILK
jgi:hypothetical protein